MIKGQCRTVREEERATQEQVQGSGKRSSGGERFDLPRRLRDVGRAIPRPEVTFAANVRSFGCTVSPAE